MLIVCAEPETSDDPPIIVLPSNNTLSREQINGVPDDLQPLLVVDVFPVNPIFLSNIRTEFVSTPLPSLLDNGLSISQSIPASADSDSSFLKEGHITDDYSQKISKKLCERPGCYKTFVPDVRTKNHKFCSSQCYDAVRRSRSRLLHCYRLSGCRFALEIYRLLGGTLHRRE